MKISAIITFALIGLATAQDFRKQNADDAEKKTQDFKKLTPDSPCKDGDLACVKDQFAQCANGKFVTTDCGGNLKCVVLPLVNRPGTSVTCSTEQDRLNRLAEARGESPKDNGKGKENIKMPGNDDKDNNNAEQPPKDDADKGNGKGNGKDDADKGNGKDDAGKGNGKDDAGKGNGKDDAGKGNGNDNADQPPADQPPKGKAKEGAAQPPENPKGKGSGNLAEIRKKNADEADKLNDDFKKLTPDSPCKDGDQACVKDQFAQCVNGKFVSTDCGPGLKCAALPLVLKEGTSIACTSEEDRKKRIDDARNGLK